MLNGNEAAVKVLVTNGADLNVMDKVSINKCIVHGSSEVEEYLYSW